MKYIVTACIMVDITIDAVSEEDAMEQAKQIDPALWTEVDFDICHAVLFED